MPTLLLKISARADRDIAQIVEYLQRQDAIATRRFVLALRETLEDLCRFPNMGKAIHTKKGKGRRVWPHPLYDKYLIFYSPGRKNLRVLRVLHQSRDIEKLMGVK